ncbi:hypothetical protein BH23VER1_BH23VER1_12430 [soil metagenome]
MSLIPDWRVDRRKLHDLTDILVIAACAMICGRGQFTHMAAFGRAREEWFRGFLNLPGGIPSHDTFRNVFAVLDPAVFLDAFGRWTGSVLGALPPLEGVVASDGKALRGALDAGAKIPVIVGAWSAQLGICLGQVRVDEKSNEITALPLLLAALDLKGCIVTLDAMGCQREVAEKVVAGGGDYVLALKGNQPGLHEQAVCYLNEMASLVDRRHPNFDRQICGCLPSPFAPDARFPLLDRRTRGCPLDLSPPPGFLAWISMVSTARTRGRWRWRSCSGNRPRSRRGGSPRGWRCGVPPT